MPNVFIQPATSGYSTQGQTPVQGTPAVRAPLYDPRYARYNRERFRRSMLPDIDKANSLYVPAGRWPARGWILLRRRDFNNFNVYRTDFQLQIDDLVRPPLTFSNLSIVQAQCVTRGALADPDAIYLVEICDLEGVMYNPWFQLSTTSQYNMRSPAYPEQYYQNSLNAGNPWTWDAMVKDLWNQMKTFLGTYPGLPITPLSNPENFAFPGVSAWEALNQIMDYLGLTVTDDPTSSRQYGIVVSGATDAVFNAFQASNRAFLEDDEEWLDGGSGRVPAFVTVFFHRRNQYYGTEETVRRDNLQWTSTPLYSINVAGPIQFANAAGTAYLWSDFTVRFDVDGNPLSSDVALAQSIAQERVTQFYNLIFRGTSGFMRQEYSGVLQFVTGSQVDGVRWFQTNLEPQERSGWRTEIIRGYVWDEVAFPLNIVGIKGPF
jgi:hypothetical protein